jgi:hypothetical protein
MLLATDHGLAAPAHVVVLDDDGLLATGPHPLQRHHPGLVGAAEPGEGASHPVCLNAGRGLLGGSRYFSAHSRWCPITTAARIAMVCAVAI